MISLFLFCAGCSAEPNTAVSSAPAEKDRLTIYTSHKAAVYAPIVREFEERTGVWVTVVTGGTNELLEIIAADSAHSECDVMFGGGIESLSSYASLFMPYDSAETDAILPAYRLAEDTIMPFSALPIVLIYNTKLVDPALLYGWSTLTDPAWKGKIAFANPEVSGSSYTMLCTMCQIIGDDPAATMAAFSKNLDGRQLSSSGDVLDAVADGQFLIGVTLEETALQHIAAGDDIGVLYPADGTSAVPDGCALLQHAPHADNARLFLEFVLGRDVQNLLVRSLYRRSVRVDADAPQSLPPDDELNLIEYNYQWSTRNHSQNLAMWREATGG